MSEAAEGAVQESAVPVEDSQDSVGSRGFPENTPIVEMTDSQRAAYFKHQNRQAERKLAAFKGFTPEQIQKIVSENETLKTSQLSESERTVKEAAEKAAAEARAAAEADWRPKYQAAQLKSAAATVIKDQEQLSSFMAITDPSKFSGEDGEIDEEKLMGHLTALFGGSTQGKRPASGPPAWGQFSGGASAGVRPGEAGKAAAEKRHGIKK